MKNKITYNEFLEIEKNLSIEIGKVIGAKRVPKSYGLELTVVFGVDDAKTCFTNLGKTFSEADFVNKSFPFVTNLEPTLIKGVTSEVMILVGETLDGNIDLELKEGSKIL